MLFRVEGEQRSEAAHREDEQVEIPERDGGNRRRRERQQPDCQLLAGLAAPEFDHRRGDAQLAARALNLDSPSYGDPLPTDLVVGRVFVLLWPSSRFSILHRPATFANVPDAG